MQEGSEVPSPEIKAKVQELEYLGQKYLSLESADESAREILLKDIQRTKEWLFAYHFGNRFAHREAYMLCSVGKVWPDFLLHPVNKDYVLRFRDMYSKKNEKVHGEYEQWVDKERKDISVKASDGLKIPWKDVESVF